MQIETVKIVSPASDDNPNGYIVINAEDFNTEEHELLQLQDSPIEEATTGGPTRNQIKAQLDFLGIEYNQNARTATLLELLNKEDEE